MPDIPLFDKLTIPADQHDINKGDTQTLGLLHTIFIAILLRLVG